MGEDIFFVIVLTLIGLVQDRKYGCLTAIFAAVVILLLIGLIISAAS